ncbi:MAG: methyltransferase family protein [Candidatus Binatia bacterium]
MGDNVECSVSAKTRDVEPSAGPNMPAASRFGSWVRRYRRVFPFPLVLVMLIGLRPKLFGNEFADAAITILGIALCGLGQSLRLWAWGSNAAAGKRGLRDRGAYALMRHPLYSGNFLILAGLVVIYNNPVAYPLLLGTFAYVYNVITRPEEKYMIENFAADYLGYRDQALPRFLPALGKLATAFRTTFPFHWQFAWHKEYQSCCAWWAGIAGLELYKDVLAHGWSPFSPGILLWVAVMGFSAALVIGLGVRK